MLHPERPFTWKGYTLMAGTAIVVGIFFCALAGKRSEEAAGIESMLNFSFVFGEELRQAPIWPLCLTACFTPNAAYPVNLLTRNKAWGLFRITTLPPSHWSWTSLVGVLCFGGFLVYGTGAEALGALSGKWKGAPRKASVYSIIGISFLIVAIVVSSTGSSQTRWLQGSFVGRFF